ncbi:MAG: hypothetical protein R2874_09855 [Desulfobacterales bacterium]
MCWISAASAWRPSVPGHLNDHYCLDHESRTLLSTDIDFSSFGPWYGNPECDIALFVGESKGDGLPGEQVCSSHKPPVRAKSGEEAFERFEMFDTHRQMIFNLCDPPATLERMVAIRRFTKTGLKTPLSRTCLKKT